MRRHGAKGIARRMIVTLAVSAALLSPRFTTPAYAQTGTVRFDNITTEQGLSQSTVTAILQDRQSFMWFGTEDGLNQYDGYQFTVYKHDPENPKSLSDNVVYSYHLKKEGERQHLAGSWAVKMTAVPQDIERIHHT